MYTGEADHALTAELVSLVDVPVLASGDITSRARAQAVLATTGSRGRDGRTRRPGQPVAAARAARRDAPSGRPTRSSPPRSCASSARSAASSAPERAVGWLRKFYGWYLRGGRLGKHMRAALATAPERRRRRAAAARGGAGGGGADRARRPRDRVARRHRRRQLPRPADLDLRGRVDDRSGERRLPGTAVDSVRAPSSCAAETIAAPSSATASPATATTKCQGGFRRAAPAGSAPRG